MGLLEYLGLRPQACQNFKYLHSISEKCMLLRNSETDPLLYKLDPEIICGSDVCLLVEPLKGNMILVSATECYQIPMKLGEIKYLDGNINPMRGTEIGLVRMRYKHASNEAPLFQVYNNTKCSILVAHLSRAKKQLRILHDLPPNPYSQVCLPILQSMGDRDVILFFSYSHKEKVLGTFYSQFWGLTYHKLWKFSSRDYVYFKLELELVSRTECEWQGPWKTLTTFNGAGLQQGQTTGTNFITQLVCHKLDGRIWRNLPTELFPNIVAKLPIVSMVRCRLVSKQWNIMLASSYFHKLLPRDCNEVWITFRRYEKPSQIRRGRHSYSNYQFPLMANYSWCPSSGLLFKFPLTSKMQRAIPQNDVAFLDRKKRHYDCISLDEVLQAELRIQLDGVACIVKLRKTFTVLESTRDYNEVWLQFEALGCASKLQFLDLYMWKNIPILVAVLLQPSGFAWLRIWQLRIVSSNCSRQWVEIANLGPNSRIFKNWEGEDLCGIHMEANIFKDFVILTAWTEKYACPPFAYNLSNGCWKVLWLHFPSPLVFNFIYKPKFSKFLR